MTFVGTRKSRQECLRQSVRSLGNHSWLLGYQMSVKFDSYFLFYQVWRNCVCVCVVCGVYICVLVCLWVCVCWCGMCICVVCVCMCGVCVAYVCGV